MDRLDQLISAKQAELDKLQTEIAERGEKHERVRIELEALKVAANARPATGSRAADKPKERRNGRRGKKGGRAAGDISLEWRKVLAAAHAQHRRLTYTDISEIAAATGIVTKMPNVRERVRSMTENGLLTGTPEIGWLVTADAIRRFGLDKAA